MDPLQGRELRGHRILSRVELQTGQPTLVHEHDETTADQWFDVDQFQAYLTLGRAVGRRMAAIWP